MHPKNNSADSLRASRPKWRLAEPCPHTPLHPLPAVFIHILETTFDAKDIEVLRIAEVSKKTGQGTSTLWLAVREGTFPPPIRLSQRSVAWIKAEVNAVLAARILVTRSGTEIDMRRFVALLIAPRQPV